LELVPTTPETIVADVAPDNPLAQIPTLVADDGTAIYDSLAIIDYLNRRAGGALLPESEPDRWAVLRRHTIGDAIIYAGVFWYTVAAQPMPGKLMRRTERALDALEQDTGALAERFTAGEIGIACALGYLDFRHPGFDWRRGRDRLAALYALWAARPSMKANSAPAESSPATPKSPRRR
jgi:glutathione S-transferase